MILAASTHVGALVLLIAPIVAVLSGVLVGRINFGGCLTAIVFYSRIDSDNS